MALYQAYAPVFTAFQAASRDHEPMLQGSSGISDRLGADLLRAFAIETRGRPDRHPRRERRRRADPVQLLLAHPRGRSRPRPARHRPGPARPPAPHGADRGRERAPAQRGHAPCPGRARARRQRRRRPCALAGDTRGSCSSTPAPPVLPARGYHDARVDDIVAAAGVSHGSFYRYFENKDDFFRVLAEEAEHPDGGASGGVPARCARAGAPALAGGVVRRPTRATAA